jgi:hypothetical protein
MQASGHPEEVGEWVEPPALDFIHPTSTYLAQLIFLFVFKIHFPLLVSNIKEELRQILYSAVCIKLG